MRSSWIICFLLFLTLINLLLPKVASAQAKIISPNYIIQMPNLNSGAGIPSSSTYKLDTTIGQTAPGLYSSSGYLVRAGFQYIHSIIPFSFSMSNFLINFGTLMPGTPVTRTSTLIVSSGGAGGYRITARESGYLQTTTGKVIPDATCDAGTCSQTAAAVWALTTTYGFGYNMSGQDVPSDFVDGTYYRHFANTALSQGDAVVMSNVNVGRGRTATITYKVNVSAVQAAGNYQNRILFTALPSF
jgi:hypothetical protein